MLTIFLQLFKGYLREFRRTLHFFKDIFINTAGKNDENLGYFRVFKLEFQAAGSTELYAERQREQKKNHFNRRSMGLYLALAILGEFKRYMTDMLKI